MIKEMQSSQARLITDHTKEMSSMGNRLQAMEVTQYNQRISFQNTMDALEEEHVKELSSIKENHKQKIISIQENHNRMIKDMEANQLSLQNKLLAREEKQVEELKFMQTNQMTTMQDHLIAIKKIMPRKSTLLRMNIPTK